MKKFVIERDLPGAGALSTEELKNISKTSRNKVSKMGKPYTWVQSFVTDDKIYCIHIAESEDVIREHSSRANFPVNSIAEVRSIIDPATSNS